MEKMDKTGRGRGRGRARGRPPGRCVRGRSDVISCGPGPRYSAVKKARPITSANCEGVLDYLTQTPSSSAATSATPSTTSAAYDTSQDLFGEVTDSQPQLVQQHEGGRQATPPHVCDVTDVMEEDDGDPPVIAVLEVSEESEAGQDVYDDDCTDPTYIPNRRDEEGDSSEGESERSRRRRLPESRRGSACSEAAGGSVQRHVLPAMDSQPTRPSMSAAEPTVAPSPQGGSAVWKFFSVCAADRSNAICSLCHQKLSRGKPNSHVGTSALRRHLETRHKGPWQEHLGRSGTQRKGHPPSPLSPSPLPPSGTPTSAALSLTPSQAPSSTPPLPLSGSCSSAHSSQVSVKELFERKKPISASHPLARRLTAGVAELLARQLLPYKLVESDAFRKFVAIGTPQWKIPGRYYFSRKAVPKLYDEVQRQVVFSLANSVGSRVHLTTDAWSAKHGQGRYITYTAHWVNLVDDGKQGVRACAADHIVTPPRLAGQRLAACSPSPPTPPATSSSLSSSSSSAEWQSHSTGAAAISSPATQPHLPRAYAACQVRRCHAILDMSCLKAESHTGPALLAALDKQVEQWLTPHQLEIGNVVCDNGSNLLSALSLGKLTHVPCMAHVLNLVVQRFVAKYPGLEGVLQQARKLCAHFRRSYTAMARFAEIQRRNNLPVRRLICDSPTRWNSTLLMFSRLLDQEKAVTQYLYNYSTRTKSGELGMFWPRNWTLMRNACRLMRPFEEVTNLVSRSEGTISDLIPYAYFLERAVRRVGDQAVLEREEEDLRQEESWERFTSDPDVSSTPAATQRGEEEEEEEEGELGGAEEDSDWDDEGGVSVEEEEAAAQQEPQQASQGAGAHARSSAIVRGWGEEEELRDVTEEEEDQMESGSGSEFVQMASFMLSSLLKDPRIKKLKGSDLYWVATLLDPRYRHKVGDLLPSHLKVERMQHYQNELSSMLYKAFRGDVTAQRPPGATGSNPPPRSTQARSARSSDLMVMSDMRTFFSPMPSRSPSGSSLRQRLDQQVADYMALSVDVDALTSVDEPLVYWVRRLDLWPELSQFAIQLLSCPSASVLSERTFSAAGGIVTEKRSRLSHKSVQHLTFIKMNEAWIPKDYCLPND